MTIIIQLYILATCGYIILSRHLKDFISVRLLTSISFLLVYAALLRVVLAFNPELPLFFHASVFLAYTVFVPGIYLCLRNFVYGSTLNKKDLVHVVPFITLVICSLLVPFRGTTIQLEVKKIWSFNSEAGYDPNVLMPLFLFIYCLTAFYFYHVLLVFKKVVLKNERAGEEEDLMKQLLID